MTSEGDVMAEVSSTGLTSATKLFQNERVVMRLREAAPYLSFISHIALVSMEVLLHRRIAMPVMEGTLSESCQKIFSEGMEFFSNSTEYETHLTPSISSCFSPIQQFA